MTLALVVAISFDCLELGDMVRGMAFMTEKATTRQKNSESAPVQTLRQLKADLLLHADYMDELIKGLEGGKELAKLKILTGNFYAALRNVRSFFTSQILTKIAATKSTAPSVDHKVLGKLMFTLGELEDKMPDRGEDVE